MAARTKGCIPSSVFSQSTNSDIRAGTSPSSGAVYVTDARDPGIATYTDGLTREPELVRLRDMATIEFVDGYPEAKADVAITTAGGQRFTGWAR